MFNESRGTVLAETSEAGQEPARASDRQIPESNVIVSGEYDAAVRVEHQAVIAQGRAGDANVSANDALQGRVTRIGDCARENDHLRSAARQQSGLTYAECVLR